jgi:hypothetical protein
LCNIDLLGRFLTLEGLWCINQKTGAIHRSGTEG